MSDVPDLLSYDYIIVAFSGGKDSLACFLRLMDESAKSGHRIKPKIELWHHDVDAGGSFFDWPVTRSYCRAVAEAFQVPIYFSWKTGGFEREMLRQESRTAPIVWEEPGGTMGTSGGTGGKLGTRHKFPQVSADLSVRWCSAYLKIDVGAAAIRGQERFLNKRTLVVSGERAQESSARAKYATFEPDRANTEGARVQRHVDRWRAVHSWKEEQVWKIIEDYRVDPHPAYKLGWGRVSCMTCIFGSRNQWATIREIDPERFQKIADYEQQFGATIKRRESISDQADKGVSYGVDPDVIRVALSDEYPGPIIVDDWQLPAGAFGESAGPT